MKIRLTAGAVFVAVVAAVVGLAASNEEVGKWGLGTNGKTLEVDIFLGGGGDDYHFCWSPDYQTANTFLNEPVSGITLVPSDAGHMADRLEGVKASWGHRLDAAGIADADPGAFTAGHWETGGKVFAQVSWECDTVVATIYTNKGRDVRSVRIEYPLIQPLIDALRLAAAPDARMMN